MRKTLEEDLSPLGQYEERMNWNPVEKVLYERRSIRSYKKEPLPDSMIKRILEAGRFAPSAGNAQPWKFVVINSKDIIEEMEKDAEAVARFFMKLLDYSDSKLKKPLAKLMIRMKKNDLHIVPFGVLKQIADGYVKVFHGAPTIILLFADTRGVGTPPIDIGIAGQNMVLTAHSLGAATCWIGLFNLLMYKRKWKRFFGVEKPFELMSTLALGYPKGDYNNIVEREVQLVEWVTGTVDEPNRRIEEQGV
ncbi:MAG: nitroreductase family protein [Promethearchaeota archaeon]|nr:MAG: nitroreductase family protein [Candidatus Lokiarchaeota archaeon]